MSRHNKHTALWIGIGVFTVLVCLFIYVFVVRSMQPARPTNSDFSEISVPQGFNVSLYAENISNATTIAWSSYDVAYVGTTQGTVYAARDFNHDGFADKLLLIAQFDAPVVVSYLNKVLYLASGSNIYKISDIDRHTGLPPKPKLVANLSEKREIVFIHALNADDVIATLADGSSVSVSANGTETPYQLTNKDPNVGTRYYTANNETIPSQYNNAIFAFNNNKILAANQTFASGWEKLSSKSRLTDIEETSTGTLLVADAGIGTIYKIDYVG